MRAELVSRPAIRPMVDCMSEHRVFLPTHLDDL